MDAAPSQPDLDWSRWPDFAEREFRCRCGCGRAEMAAAFLDRLQAIRDRLGRPMVMSSGFRCPDYNAQVSTTGRDGPHTTGRAADIAVAGADAELVESIALDLGITGRGVKQHGRWADRFLHLDDIEPGGAQPRPRLWSYP
jgi:uncharacterized protein YcbK (DUF882 family)